MRDVCKTYPGISAPVVRIAEFTLLEGQQLALYGRSGSGKSTFLNIAAGLLRPDTGSVCLDGTDLFSLSESRRDRYRGRKLGYVFQSFHLLPGLSVWENLWIAAALAGTPDPKRLQHFLQRLDLCARRGHRPHQLSPGQQQRVALARALVQRPRLVLADEPTGNLDAELAREAIELLREMCAECGAALLLVSHSQAVLDSFPQTLAMTQLNGCAC